MAASSMTISVRGLLIDERVPVFSELAECILVNGAYKATKYLSEKVTVKATRKLFKYNGRKIDKRSKSTEIIFTVGRPNSEEREFIKKAKKAGEPFPIKKIHLKFPKSTT